MRAVAVVLFVLIAPSVAAGQAFTDDPIVPGETPVRAVHFTELRSSFTSTFYLGACIESVAGESDTENNCSLGAPVTVIR